MPRIKPFSPFIYNKEKIKCFEDVVSPPYDVIKDRNVYARRHEYNIVRLILPENEEEAGNLFKEWIKEKVFIKERKGIYVYEQKYMCRGVERRQKGFVALLNLEDDVLLHEQVFEEKVKERKRLLSAIGANLCFIFAIYWGEEPKFRKEEAILSVKDDEGVEHKLYIVDEEDDIKEFEDFMKEKEVMIADGHHRFTAACSYMKEGGHPFAMTYFLPSSSAFLLSTHRVVFCRDNLLERLKEAFSLHPLTEKHFIKEFEEDLNAAALYYNHTFYKLKKHVDELDVVVLHKIFDSINHRIYYTKDICEGMDVAKEEGGYLFLLHPPSVEQIREKARKNEYLPQKTTYFYPKQLSGLLIYRFDDDTL